MSIKRIAYVVLSGIALGLWASFSHNAGWSLWEQLAGGLVVMAIVLTILISASTLFERKRAK